MTLAPSFYSYLNFVPCPGSPGSAFTVAFDAAFWANVQGNIITFTNIQNSACFTVGKSNALNNVTPPNYDSTIDVSVMVENVDYTLFNGCEDCIQSFETPPGAYKLVECNTSETLCLANTPPGLYAAVVIPGYPDNCWRVEYDPNGCTGPTVFISDWGQVSLYKTCVECQESLPRTYYKLEDCSNPENVLYTTTDLSDYVDPSRVVTLNEFDGCYFVRAITSTIPPPSDITVTVLESYVDCEVCGQDFYILTDCRFERDPITTTTDLSALIGQIITIEECPDVCWEVQNTEPTDNPIDVTVTSDPSFVDCPECLKAILPCRCQSIFNNEEIANAIRYVDCNGDQQSVVVAPGTRTEKLCILYWVTGTDPIDYGSCIENYVAKTWECPLPPQPKRKVTPGYDTPICSTDYYEKVECTFSELMYKDVLAERYGISNCCPEDDMKWIIKHEMLMLDILVNPDYECSPVSTCDCPVIGGGTLNTACPEITHYIIERCDEPETTEVVRIENQYDVLGNIILIDDICYTVVEVTTRLVTVYWTPGTIYTTCQECADAQV